MRLKSSDGLRVAGRMTVRATPAGSNGQGEPLYEMTTPNLVVDSGLALVGNMLVDTEDVGLTYHAIGTGTATPATGDTALATETARKAWTSKVQVGATLTYTVFYLASECSYNIAEVGVFGSATASASAGSGTLFSRLLQAYDNSAGLVDLTFEYELTIG